MLRGFGIRTFSMGVALSLAMVAAPAFAQDAAQPAAPVLALDGDAATITVLIKPDKTADFEMVLARLREALLKSDKPVRRQQADGWFIYKGAQPVQGNAVYIMRIEPVVAGEEYDISRLIAEVFPTEVQDIFAKYRDAFAGRAIAAMTPMPGQ